jgi:hypothetical protein
MDEFAYVVNDPTEYEHSNEEEDYGDLWEEDDEENNDEIVRAKWTIDGANTLAEAACMAKEFSQYLQMLHDQGYVLRSPIDDDYGFYYKPNEESK